MLKILIVDDNPINQKLMLKWLSDFGECSQVKDGAHAIKEFHQEMLKGDPYDLFILDLNMPKINGNRVLSHIREYEEAFELKEYLKVIMFSGENSGDKVMELFKLGCEHYLVKPVQKEKLFQAMTDLGFSPI